MRLPGPARSSANAIGFLTFTVGSTPIWADRGVQLAMIIGFCRAEARSDVPQKVVAMVVNMSAPRKIHWILMTSISAIDAAAVKAGILALEDGSMGGPRADRR